MAAKLTNDDLRTLTHRYPALVSENCQKHFSILVTGKTGVGKSRLVNALVGRPVAQEGRLRTACTDTVTAHRAVIYGVEVVVWDSPGLQDGSCNERLYLADMKQKLDDRGFDVMIYCLSMTETRFQDADKNAIRTMTEFFGKDMWKKAVVALNFANRISDPDEEDELAYFMNEKYSWNKVIDELLASLGIDCKVRDAIPVVPTGTYKKLRLPTCNNWLSELWMSCYSVMTDSSALTWYRINKDRVKFPRSSTAPAAACSHFCEEDNQLPGIQQLLGLIAKLDTTQGPTAPTAAVPCSPSCEGDNQLPQLPERDTTQGPTAPVAAVACSNSCEDDDQLMIPERDTTQQGPDDLGDIPREIPLNKEQEEKFWKKIWSAFVNGCRKVKLMVLNLSHAVLSTQ